MRCSASCAGLLVRPMPERKRIAVIVEWEGACPEVIWAQLVRSAVEADDEGVDTNVRAVRVITLTDIGVTDILSDAELRASILRIDGERTTLDVKELDRLIRYWRGMMKAAVYGGDMGSHAASCYVNAYQCVRVNCGLGELPHDESSDVIGDILDDCADRGDPGSGFVKPDA